GASTRAPVSRCRARLGRRRGRPARSTTRGSARARDRVGAGVLGRPRCPLALLSALLPALLRGGVVRAGVRVGDLCRALLGHALLAQPLVLLVVLDAGTVIFSHA